MTWIKTRYISWRNAMSWCFDSIISRISLLYYESHANQVQITGQIKIQATEKFKWPLNQYKHSSKWHHIVSEYPQLSDSIGEYCSERMSQVREFINFVTVFCQTFETFLWIPLWVSYLWVQSVSLYPVKVSCSVRMLNKSSDLQL